MALLSGIRRPLYHGLARLDIEHPYLVLLGAFVLSLLSILYTKARLEFRTGRDDLISDSSRDSRNYLAYVGQFPDLDGLIVVVRAQPDPARAERFTETLAARLSADRANVKSVFYRIEPQAFANRALLYLSRDELAQLASRVRDNRELLKLYAAQPGLATLFRLMNREAGRAMVSRMVSELLNDPAPAPAQTAPPSDLGFVNSLLGGMLAGGQGSYRSPWDYLTRGAPEDGALRDGFVVSDNGKYLLMHVAPADGSGSVEAIQRTLDLVRAKFLDLEAGMTGGPALAHAEALSTEHDIALASVLAIVSNVLLITIPFGGLIEPAFAIIALLVGVAWSFGFATFSVGHLNLLSAVFTSVLAGIGINFPIHLMARYDEARRRGRTMEEALELSLTRTGTAVVASASIMALAFVTPMFTDFRGIAELGLISAAGLSLCLVSALFVFPPLVAIRDRHAPRMQPATGAQPGQRSRLEALFRRPGLILIAACALTATGLVLIRSVDFDQNLLKLQAEDSEAVKFEEKLLKDSGRSSWFAVALARNRREAERKAAAFRRLPEVSESETIATYIPDFQDRKRAILASLRPLIEPLEVKALPAGADSADLLRQLKDFSFKLDGARGEGGAGETAGLLARAIATLQRDPQAFADYQRRMAADFAAKLELLKQGLAPGEITEANLPQILRSRFIGTGGAYLVQIYPSGDIWEDAPLERFVEAVRRVDGDVTGPPIQTYSLATVMRRGYERAALLALLGVFVLVFVDFRNLRDTALATVPLLFGAIWLLETMGALGWDFNLANLFAIPIIIGTGVDNGVNMVYRWREEPRQGQIILRKAVGKSVTLCSLTTIAGFAALIPASHRGISSLGWVLSVGVSFILIATLVVLPALFKIVGSRGAAAESAAATPMPSRRVVGDYKLVLVLGCSAACLLAASPAGADSRSDALVKQAESMILQAQARDPLDTAQVWAAIRKLEQAVDQDPHDDAAFVDLGFAYGLMQDSNQAIDMYNKAVRINPSAANFKELANVYLRSARPEEALMAANAGLSKESANAALYNARGMALHDLTRFDEALQDFRHALALDPSMTTARDNLRILEQREGPGRSTISKQHGSKNRAAD